MTAQPDARGHFGPYGGRYVSEILMPNLYALERAWREIVGTAAFEAELDDLLTHYVGRPSPLYLAQRLTDHAGRLDEALLAFDRLLTMARDHLPPGSEVRMTYESNAAFAMAMSPMRRDEGIKILESIAALAHANGPPIQEVYSLGALADALHHATRQLLDVRLMFAAFEHAS